MENDLKYYYNMEVKKIKKMGRKFLFEYNGSTYIFEEVFIMENDINNINNLSIMLLYNNIPMHVLMMNKFSKFITPINERKFVLMRVIAAKKNIEIEDVFKFMKLVDSGKCTWKELWISKLEYFEWFILNFEKKLSNLKEYFYYYEGFAEMGLSMLENNANFDIYISHKRINDNPYDFYNPLNITNDIKCRDAAEYVKYAIYNEIEIDNIYEYIDFALDFFINKEKVMFFIRLLFNSYYFDIYEKIINDNILNEDLIKIKKHIKDYEQILLYAYNKIDFYIKMPNISCLSN